MGEMIRYLANQTFPLCRCLNRRRGIPRSTPLFGRLTLRRLSSTKMIARDDGHQGFREFVEYMEKLRNYERIEIPRNAGTDSQDGFDLGRMRRLLHRLGDPHLGFQAVHIAGTKGKGSTAAFLSTILREEGYSVGCYTSPHLLSIRECISFGRSGEPVSAIALANLFHKIKGILDESIQLENGALTYFEVFTAIAFSLFAQENVDMAIVEAGLGGARDATNVLTRSRLAAAIITTIGEEHLAALGGSLESIAIAKAGIIKQGCPLVICGPFQHHIEVILRNKASSMSSPVISATDPGIQSFTRSYWKQDSRSYQTCDILVNVDKDLPLSIKLNGVNLQMLGDHQLQNAITATCTALCLRNQGWKISDRSIHAGLEQTMLPGRGHFLTNREVEAFGLSGVSVLIDGAHTEASAKCLADTIRKTNACEAVALVVATASDKNHIAFSRQLLSGLRLDVVLLTEVRIAGSRSRMTSASSLKDYWLHCAKDLGADVLDIGDIGKKRTLDEMAVFPVENQNHKPILIGYGTESVLNLIKAANQLLKSRMGKETGLIVVTGSLHIAASVLASIHK